MKKLALVLAVLAGSASAVELKTDAQKVGYAIGTEMGGTVLNITENGGEIDFEALLAGLKDVYEKKEPALKPEEMEQAIENFMAKQMEAMQAEEAKRQEEFKKLGEQAKEEGAKFLAENKGKEGVKTTDSGLQYRVITEGKGDKPTAKDEVKVHYAGRLINGTEFDSSYKRNEPTSFPLNAVIAGWTEGLQLMPVGSKFEFFIPAELAYGENGAGGEIPPHSVLIFEVELLEILKGNNEVKPTTKEVKDEKPAEAEKPKS